VKYVTRVALIVTITSAVGCSREMEKRGYEYMPDMARTAAYKSFSSNPATRDGLTLQRPVAGTVPRGFQPFHYGAGPDEAKRAGRELRNPFPSTPEALLEGQLYYETFCFVCHGANGRGDGPLVPKIPNPPSYTSERLLAMPPGQIFHVITMGSGRMPSYASQVSAAERWEIVAYVRFLQHNGAQPHD
jgi:mono/diheme cytochrome c family protein